MNTNIEYERQSFLAANAKATNGSAQPAKLRICAVFQNGKLNYIFDPKKTGGHVTDVPLQDNDLFIASSLALGIMVEDNAKVGYAPTVAYPLGASAELTAMGLKGLASVAPAYALYNGDMNVKTNQTVNIEKLPLSHFLNVPKAENAGVVGSNVSEAQYTLPMRLEFSGKKQHQIGITIPADSALNIAGEAGSTAYLVLEMYGYLCQGAATR